ncbi:MAG: citrate/2-methylcitrate synthase [Candidatus Hodarchaeales archaeon]
MSLKRINADQGLLSYLIKSVRPKLANNITQTKNIETMIIGLGRQGTRHAKLMQDYGSSIICGVSPGKGGTKVHESIPVYETAHEALKHHPNVAVASIWRYFSTAKDSAIEVIEAGVPIVVLITEGIPLRDVRDILVAARKNKTILIGGNTPGIIFPPEGIKIGMLPDVFHPEEIEPKRAGPKGVTIISRSGAILYHLSDALASAGIAQNAVLGIGGDGAIGSRFVDLVSLVMNYKNTDLVVIAGEIGGMQEEILAQDIQNNPEKYTKPLIALISGANSPEGKTMGHAGAVIAPGQNFGTYISKKDALVEAGVEVVNHQRDLIEKVKEKLENKIYFNPDDYYKRMKITWDKKPPIPTWSTLITKVVPNSLIIRGYPLQELIGKKSFLEIAYLVMQGELPTINILKELETIAISASQEKGPLLPKMNPTKHDLSKILGMFILVDEKLLNFNTQKEGESIKRLAYTLGRIARYISIIMENQSALENIRSDNESFSQIIFSALVGENNPDRTKLKLLEAMITACVDHGVTPPSAQTTLLLSSTRASYEVALSGGVQAITDVHGGAGTKAAEFFLKVVNKSTKENQTLEEATYDLVKLASHSGQLIEGLGHRIHTQDPRRDILWQLAEEAKQVKECITVSQLITKIFYRVKGMALPINVDGVIGAITADMGLKPLLAKAIFIFGRIVGLAAHFDEEIQTQPPMRRIVFEHAIYKGPPLRHIE